MLGKKNLPHKKILWAKKIFAHKIFLSHKKILWAKKIFSHKNFFPHKKILRAKKFFAHKIFLSHEFESMNVFESEIKIIIPPRRDGIIISISDSNTFID